MRRLIFNGILKKLKHISLFKPNDIRLSFYMKPIKNISFTLDFELDNLDNLVLLNDDIINPDLVEQPSKEEDGNLYALLDESCVKGVLTGAELGIYNYPDIDRNVKKNKDYTKFINDKFVKSLNEVDEDTIRYSSIDDGRDEDFTHCVLAQGDSLADESTKIVVTFKGYLEVRLSEYSVIRSCDIGSKISFAYISRKYIDYYKLRNGDEILCTCSEIDGNMVVTSLFNVNQISRYNWNYERPWIRDLKQIKTSKDLKPAGDFSQEIVDRFGLFKGDNVFMYLTKNSQKNIFIPQLIDELDRIFDKIIYINPMCQSSVYLGENHNITRFCTSVMDTPNKRATVTLLGINHIKRMIEMGKNVVVLVDDINTIYELEKQLEQQFPICQNLLNNIIVTKNGSSTDFILVPLRFNSLKSVKIPDVFKSSETMGIVIENNQIDLFNSYRI